MRSEWKVSTLNDVCTLITDGAHNSPKSVSDGMYMASVKDFTEYGFDFSNCKMITPIDYEKLEKQGCVPLINDVLVGKDGARYFEDIIIYRQNEKPALLSSIAILRVDPKVMLPEFLYYMLKSPDVKKNVRDNYGSGSAIPRIVLKDFRRMPITYPSIEEQIRLVSPFISIDKKIQTNITINENLADQIQAIYSYEFDPSTHTPSGTLANICKYSSDKIPVSKLSVSTYYSTENMQPNKKGSVDATSLPSIALTTGCHKGDVLISNIRPYFKKIVYITDDSCGCSTDVLCFVPKEDQYSAFLFGTLYMDRFFDYMVAGSKGTKMPRGDKQQIMNYPVVLPDKESLDFFNGLIIPMMDQIAANRLESSRLTALRDTLLPKLMSGELDVSNLDI